MKTKSIRKTDGVFETGILDWSLSHNNTFISRAKRKGVDRSRVKTQALAGKRLLRRGPTTGE